MENELYSYFIRHEGEWFKKVQLYVIADEAGYSPETCGRTLRDMAKIGTISVGYYDGKYAKNLAKYAYKPPEVKIPTITYKEENGRRIAVLT